jgi:hypothetical protein
MDFSIRLLRLVQTGMLVSILLYILIGQRLGSIATLLNNMTFYVLSMVTVTIVGVILVVRRTLVSHSASALAARPEDPLNLGRWRAGYMMTYALSESIALFGFVLRLTGFSLSQVAPFYIAGFILLLFFGPRRPESPASA